MNIQNGVICGLSDWLYLHYGSNSLWEYHTGAKQLSKEDIERWRETLQNRHEWHQSRNIKYLQVIAPNKICVYPEFFSENLKFVGKRPIEQLIENCGSLFTYQLDYLVSKKTQYELYHKTDTHWNKIGAFFAYEQIMNLLDDRYRKNCLKIEQLKLFKENKIGDLGGRFDPPKSTYTNMAEPKKFRAKKYFDNQVSNRGKVRKFKNNEIKDGKLIIFGDSFTNIFMDFLAESFRELIFVHATFVDFDYVEAEKPDIVINHTIERFIIEVPDDLNAPKAEEYAKVLGKI